MSIYLTGFDWVRQFQCRGDLTLGWIDRVLIQFKFFDCDLERRRLVLVSQSLQLDVRRDKFLVEDDLDFLVGWPVLRRFEEHMFVVSSYAFPGQRRGEPDVL